MERVAPLKRRMIMVIGADNDARGAFRPHISDMIAGGQAGDLVECRVGKGPNGFFLLRYRWFYYF